MWSRILTHMTCQICQSETEASLAFSEQFEIIQNKARLEVIAETSEHQNKPWH